jgi:REP element-mobilizing transposase RayT
MPFWRSYYHLIWATKDRVPLIQPAIERRLFPYLISKARESKSNVYAINGWTDHVHLVASIPPSYAVADVVKSLKGASSHFLNHEVGLQAHFAWQRGYGVLTVGERQRPIAEEYVRRQKEHHQRETTIAWLERVDEFDDGPPDVDDDASAATKVLREESAVYSVAYHLIDEPSLVE